MKMFKKNSLLLLVFTMVLACSEEITEELVILQGQITGTVTLATEFNARETEHSGATLTLEGGPEPLTTVTDASGSYTFQDVSTGSYNVRIEKPGYDTYQQKVSVMGGDEPLYLSYTLYRIATTTIENPTLTYSTSNNAFVLSGNVIYDHPAFNPFIRLAVFFSTTSDVSPEKHIRSQSVNFYDASGAEGSWNFWVDASQFPSGSDMHVVVYAYSGGPTLDMETGKYVYQGLGEPSEVLTITIP